MNIYQRLNEVRKTVAYVKKDASVQGYKAVTHDMVTAVTRDHLVKHGVMIFPTLVSSSMEPAGQTSKGTPIFRMEAIWEVKAVNIDDPGDQISILLPAHANDSSDKAPGKCCSYAVKYALLKLLSLETGENEEGRMEADRRAEAAIEHIKMELQEYLDANDALAVYLLQRQVGHEIWSDIYNSAPDGSKVKFKKEVSEAERTGAAVFKAVNSAILTQDAGAAAENLEDVTDGGKRLLAMQLGREKSEALGDLMKQVKT